MSDELIREVERDPDEGIVVTIENEVDDLEVPQPCAACLGDATRRYPVFGMNWLEIPYCEKCVAPRTGKSLRRAIRMTVIVVVAVLLALFATWWFFLLALLLLADLRGSPRGDAVKLLHSPSGTYRVGFKNEDYARLFVEANGVAMPPA